MRTGCSEPGRIGKPLGGDGDSGEHPQRTLAGRCRPSGLLVPVPRAGILLVGEPGLANKAFNVVECYEETIARIHRHNITVQAGIVFGFDGDDESTFEATLREAAPRPGRRTVSILTPFPKTPIYIGLQRSGRLLDERLELLQRQDRRDLPPGADDRGGTLERVHVLPPPLLLARMHSPATRPFARAHGAIPRPQPGLRTCPGQPLAWLANPRPAA